MNIKLTALVIFIVGAILTILGVINITSTVIASKNYKKLQVLLKNTKQKEFTNMEKINMKALC